MIEHNIELMILKVSYTAIPTRLRSLVERFTNLVL